MTVRRGLVLSGGAALGAYQAGALQVLHENGIEFEVISATSIGILHALAWNMEETIRTLDRHWIENVAGLRPFHPLRLLRGQNPFQFGSTLDSVFDRYRHQYPQRPEKKAEILVTVTERKHCRPVVFSMDDPTLDRDEREAVLKASTVIPHLGFPPILLRGSHYYDGGYTDNLPVSPLRDRDLDEIWMIPLMPVLRRKRAHHRVQRLWWHVARRFPSSRLRPLLLLMSQFLQPAAQGAASDPKIVLVAPDGLFRSFSVFHPIHALTFSQKNIQRLLRQGSQDAREVCRTYGEQASSEISSPF